MRINLKTFEDLYIRFNLLQLQNLLELNEMLGFVVQSALIGLNIFLDSLMLLL